jgi:hypothetical protein
MAKIKTTAIVADIRGKLNGTVFSKGRGGAYMRTKVTPSNPQTEAQAEVRARLGSFAQGWRSLSEEVRSAWNGAVANFSSTDIFGDIRNPSGINLYTKLNSNLAEAGQAAITNPPLPSGAAAVTTISATGDVSDSEIEVVTGAGNVPVGNTLIIRATAPLSPGKSFVKNLLRNVDMQAAGASETKNIWTAYVAKFGAPVAGQKIGIEAYHINNTTGEKSPSIGTTLIMVP